MSQSAERQDPRAGDIWRSNSPGKDRSIRIVETDCRYAYVQNVATGRPSRIELQVFGRCGVSGWTKVDRPVDLWTATGANGTA